MGTWNISQKQTTLQNNSLRTLILPAQGDGIDSIIPLYKFAAHIGWVLSRYYTASFSYSIITTFGGVHFAYEIAMRPQNY